MKRDWEGRGELFICRDQLVERNQMKGKKPETGEEQARGNRWEAEKEGRRISYFEGLFQQKKFKVRGNGICGK